MIKHLISAAALATAFAVTGSTSVSAERPVERFRFVNEFTDVEPLFTDYCGTGEVTVDGIARIQINEFAGGRARIHQNIHITFTNTDTGDQLFLSTAHLIKDVLVSESVDGDLLTVVYETDFMGTPEKWRAPGFGVIVRDAGRASFRATVVIDLTVDPEIADPVVSVDEEVLSQNGPHPLADQGFFFNEEQGAQICAAIGGQLGG